MRGVIAALAFGAAVASVAIMVGTRDVESYEHAVFSLNRGTAVEAVSFLGQPVYTLALGFGVRLPLHGSLGASPAALLAPYLPVAITYWLLLAFTIAAAVLVVHQALEPTCGRLVSWAAAVLLFCSVPMVNYTIYDDWPETAVTYCAYVVCVFAPHAMLESSGAATRARRRIAGFSVLATVWAFLVLAHPGYWPLLALTLVLTGAVALSRTEYPLTTRVTVLAAVAAVSLVAVGLPALDILREFTATSAGGDTDRAVDVVPAGVLASNLFPFTEIDARFPFSYLVLAAVAILIGMTAQPPGRVVIIGSALASIALVVGTTALSPRGAVSSFAPSAAWALRDPAGVFAVLSGAWAAAAIARSWSNRRFVPLTWGAAATLAIAALQGPAYAAQLIRPEFVNEEAWTRSLTPPATRASDRGLAPDRVPPGRRLALWPGVREAMREARVPSIDFADAGYLLVTGWTKQRTMRGLIVPNSVLFNQTTDLSAEILCDGQAVRFLQIRYLLRPAGVPTCAPWSAVPELRVDEALAVDEAREIDERIRAVPIGRFNEPFTRKPALAAGSELVPALVPLAGTSVVVDRTAVVLRFDDPSVAIGQVLVLPVAFDPAWRPSSGDVRDVGGLLALVGVYARELTLTFEPDAVAMLRALAMTLAQIAALAGVVGLAYVGRATSRKKLVGTTGFEPATP